MLGGCNSKLPYNDTCTLACTTDYVPDTPVTANCSSPNATLTSTETCLRMVNRIVSKRTIALIVDLDFEKQQCINVQIVPLCSLQHTAFFHYFSPAVRGRPDG